MRIAVVVPDERALNSAGVRVRYDRLRPVLQEMGHKLDFIPIGQFRDKKAFSHDLYIFLKIYDARALVLARRMRAKGRRVGLDVIDDYFSPSTDPRLVHLRRWFQEMRSQLDLILCGTPALAARLDRLAPGVPCYILTDPAPMPDPAALANRLPRKAARALASQTLDVGWFGIGDNPLFDLGLGDLFAFGDSLAEANRHGFSVRLTVLTNARALDQDGLERIARLPVPTRVDEWSLEKEADLVAQSLLCFLPVNFQTFSVTKSLNRGMIALAGGTQILSAGYPLYEPLAPFVYCDMGDLLSDLRAGTLRLRDGTLDALQRVFARLGDPAAEAQALTAFLQSVPTPTPDEDRGRPLAVIDGVQSAIGTCRQVQLAGGLFVATPLTRNRAGFDVAEDPAQTETPVLFLSAHAVRLLRPGLQSQVISATGRDGAPAFRLRLRPGDLPGLPPRPAWADTSPRIAKLAGYRQGLARTRALLAYLFDDPQIVLSEQVSPYFDGFASERGR